MSAADTGLGTPARPAGRAGLNDDVGRDGSDGARGSRGSIDSEPEIEETASIDGAQGSRLSDIEGQLQEMAAIDGAQGSRGSDIEAWLAPPPPVFFLTVFAPRPAGSPGSGVVAPVVPPAVTQEGPMPLVVWLARMNPPHFRCLADWLEHLEWVGFIRRYDVIVLTDRYEIRSCNRVSTIANPLLCIVFGWPQRQPRVRGRFKGEHVQCFGET